jgi:peptidoglycan/xylan/chitin deacetylase (PgdA/CDA1 family)
MPFRRPAITWPNGARLAIVPCVAFETWPEDLGRPGSMQNQNRRSIPKGAPFDRDLAVITDREFGERVGIYRMLDVFDRVGIRTSFFFNGVNAERFPELTRQIDAAGHEVATENYIHDYSYMKTRAQEEADQQRTVDAIRNTIGKPPVGYLSTGVRPSMHTPEIIASQGYQYWMDMQHEELPYVLKVGDRRLVCITYTVPLNDYTTHSSRTPRQHGEVWRDTVAYLHRESETYPNMVAWGMHPFLSGRPFRAAVLEEFLTWAKSRPGVWFARTRDIAEWWLAEYPDHLVEEWPHFTERGVPVRELTR